MVAAFLQEVGGDGDVFFLGFALAVSAVDYYFACLFCFCLEVELEVEGVVELETEFFVAVEFVFSVVLETEFVCGDAFYGFSSFFGQLAAYSGLDCGGAGGAGG